MSDVQVERPAVQRRRGLAHDRGTTPADAGRDLAAELLALGPGWHVRHGLRPSFRAPVLDHVVAGPGGLFAVVALRHDDETVWVRGENLLVSGRWAPQLTDVRRGAQAMSTVLSDLLGRPLPVTPVVALVGSPARCAIPRRPLGAHVAVSGSLAAWLHTRPAALSAADVDAIDRYVRDPITWDARRAG